MRDREFHDACAVAALTAMIAKIPFKEVAPSDEVFRMAAAGAIAYANAMVEQRRMARSRFAVWLWWAPRDEEGNK